MSDATTPIIKDMNGVSDQYSSDVWGSGHEVTLNFSISVNPDHFPPKRIRVFWGENYSNIEESTTLNDLFEFSHHYSVPRFITGRTLCIEAMDNWDIKRVVCGKFYRPPNGTHHFEKWCHGFGLDDPASPSALIESVVKQCN